MLLFIYIVIPFAWMATGKLLGVATAAAHFYSAAGKRRGRIVANWLVWTLPLAYLALVFTGLAGNAARVTLFDNDDLFVVFGAVPLYAVAVLGVFSGAVYVIRDLTVGHTQSAQ